MALRTRTYEITFVGRAGGTLRAAFDDHTMIEGPGSTTLRAQVPDQAALWGLILRIIGLGLEVVDLHLVVPEAELTATETATGYAQSQTLSSQARTTTGR
jgi:hypothetical protein